VSNTVVLYDIAEEMATQDHTFRLDKFHESFQGTDGQKSFRSDWEETKKRDIIRFPTWLISKEGKGTIHIAGYRTYESLCKSLFFLDPSVQDVQGSAMISEYRKFWGHLTPREELEFSLQSDIQTG
jgi:hypothetical protein